MTHMVERLVELRRHLDHLRAIRPRVTSADVLRRDLSLHNDVLFSLLAVCQLVIDVSAELSARRGARFEDYTEAVHMPLSTVMKYRGRPPRLAVQGSARRRQGLLANASRCAPLTPPPHSRRTVDTSDTE